MNIETVCGVETAKVLTSISDNVLTTQICIPSYQTLCAIIHCFAFSLNAAIDRSLHQNHLNAFFFSRKI